MAKARIKRKRATAWQPETLHDRMTRHIETKAPYMSESAVLNDALTEYLDARGVAHPEPVAAEA